MAVGPGLPGQAGTRRNTHPLTPILIIGHPLSTSSIYYDPQHPLCSVCVLDSPFQHLSLGPPLWSSSWSWTLYFILHAFLHPVIIFFSKANNNTNDRLILDSIHSPGQGSSMLSTALSCGQSRRVDTTLA